MKNWDLIEQYFARASELDPGAAEAFVASISDDDVRAEVSSLLDAGRRGEGFVSGITDDVACAIRSGDPMVGRTVGPYRVVDRIGQGGMGAVYKATRADGAYVRDVALKLIRFGLDTPDVRERFLREQRLLAGLEHAFIARLYDAGVVDGIPYLAMELIDGLPVTAYCDTRALGIIDRLKHFGAICDAVHYAHQNLIIHRDLKPSNILVATDGQVKLLDFGISKLVDEGDDAGTLTRTTSRLLTPDYASPEQLAGDPITTATDIYSLGAVLYELLTGVRPQRRAGSVADVRGGDPIPPSRAATDSVELSAARATTVSALRKSLGGDLDAIVMTALSDNPSRRYASAEAFKADVQRFVSGMPVLARRDSVAYRAGKFVRRNRVAVSAAAAFVTLLVSATIVIAILQVSASRDRDTAQAVAVFLEGLFEASDPYAYSDQRLDTLRAPDLIDRGRQRLGLLDDEPQVQARLSGILGNVYRGIGVHDSAIVLHTKAAEMSAELGWAAEARARTLIDLAKDYIVIGRGAEAVDVLEQALAYLPVGRGETRGDVLQQLASALRLEGAFGSAVDRLEESIAIQRSLDGDGRSLELASRLSELSLTLRESERYIEAEPWIREALDIWDEVGRDHPEKASLLLNYGSILRNLGKLEEAEAAFEEAKAIETRILGADHPTIAMTVTHLAEVARDRKDYATSVRLYREAVDRIVRLDPENVGVAIMSGLLANVMRENGDYAEAEKMYLSSIAHMKRHMPPTHVRIGRSYLGLGTTYRMMKRYPAAEAALLEARAILGADGNPGVERADEALEVLYAEWTPGRAGTRN